MAEMTAPTIKPTLHHATFKTTRLQEMIDWYGVTMGDFIGTMIDTHYQKFLEQRRNIVSGIADDYSGMPV